MMSRDLDERNKRENAAEQAIVYVVQKPLHKDRDTGQLVPRFDLNPAKVHGKLVFLLGQDVNPFIGLQRPIDELREKLHDFKKGDCVLLVGNPILIGLTVAIATEYCFEINFLQWNGKERKYVAVSADLR